MNSSPVLQVRPCTIKGRMPLLLTATTNKFLNTIREQELLTSVAVFVAYVLTAKLGQYIFFGLHTSPAVIWPPAGIALAAVLLGGYRMWVPIALAETLTILTSPTPPPFSVALITILVFTFAPVIGTYILTYFGFRNSLNRTRDVLLLIGLALILPAIDSAIVIAAQWLSHSLSVSWQEAMTRAWAGKVFSILMFTPVIISWASFIDLKKIVEKKRLAIEAVAALLLLVGSVYVVFWTSLPQANVFISLYGLLGVLFWIGLRLGPRVMSLSLLITTSLGMLGSFLTHVSTVSLPQQLFSDELFMVLIAPIFLILAALVEERRITAQRLKKSIEELKSALEKLGREDESKNEFIATLAHELRNPLAPIVSTLEYLKLEEKVPETHRLIESAEEQTHIMRRLLDDLLDVARVTRKRFKLQQEVLSLQSVITRSVDTVKIFMHEQGHTLDVIVPENPILVYGDTVRLLQIFTNILFNAAKYTQNGGYITLEAYEEGGEAVVAIADNGVGIEEDRLGQIFEPFLHIGPHRSVGTGLGIGLSLTKRLVEMHHGDIEAFSEGANRGSTFVVHLPLSPATIEPLQTHPAPQEARTSEPLRILVVDDNKAAAQAMERLLTRKGHVVEMVYDGESVLAAVSSLSPNVILLDIGLPGIDGYEVARRLRTLTTSPYLVALTGYGQEDDKNKAFNAGFNHHLTKPVGLTDLENVLGSIGD
jgi:signal transduction histidine kinase/CheY-like chemotaxis protein